MTDKSNMAATNPADRHHPRGFWFIFWGELAERASFYGMKTLLLLYMIQKLEYSDADSAWVVSMFTAFCYVLPILGGYIADHWLGKFKTIIYFAIPYIMGHIVLGTYTNEVGLYIALLLLAGGSGSIKPNISTLMGLMYQQQGKSHLMTQAFSWFYMAINIGAAATTFSLPLIRDAYGYSVAFMAPTILMTVSLAIFYLGKKHYPVEQIGRGPRERKSPEQKHEERTVLIRLSGLFLLIVLFWSIFDQSYSTWTLLARDYMILDVKFLNWSFHIPPDAIQSLNPVLIVIMTPLFAWIWSRTDQSETKRISSPRKMLIGFVLVIFCMGVMSLGAFLASDRCIEVFNKDQATHASAIGKHETRGRANAIDRDDSLICAVDRIRGLQIFQHTDGELKLLSATSVRGDGFDLALESTRAYVADGEKGFAVFDLNDLNAPQIIGYDTAYYVKGLEVSGDFAFLAAGTDGLRIYDVRKADSLKEIGMADTADWQLRKIILAGTKAYALDSLGGVWAIDISDPSKPAILSHLEPPGEAMSLMIAGNYAYLAAGSAGLQVLDISNPSAMTLAGNFKDSAGVLDVAIDGNTAYLARGRTVIIMNIADPSQPRLESLQATSYWAKNLFVEGNLLLVDSEDKISVLWELIAYILITMAELCISVVGLQLAFEEAPARMKSTITGIWLFTVFLGDTLAAWFSRIYTQTSPGNFFSMMTLMIAIVTVIFYFIGRKFDRKPARNNSTR